MKRNGVLEHSTTMPQPSAPSFKQSTWWTSPPRNGSFTWTNRRGGDRLIASRLDRFLVSESILLEGITIDSDILPYRGSDHWPITLEASIMGIPKNMPFRFEKLWLTHKDFSNNIKTWWKEPLPIEGTEMFKLQVRLKFIKAKLKT